MIDPIPLMFGGDWSDLALEGVPAIECVLRAFVGCCQACGAEAEEQFEGSVLINLIEVNGTLYGDAYCADCIDTDELDGPSFTLPPLPCIDEAGEA